MYETTASAKKTVGSIMKAPDPARSGASLFGVSWAPRASGGRPAIPLRRQLAVTAELRRGPGDCVAGCGTQHLPTSTRLRSTRSSISVRARCRGSQSDRRTGGTDPTKGEGPQAGRQPTSSRPRPGETCPSSARGSRTSSCASRPPAPPPRSSRHGGLPPLPADPSPGL